MSRTSSVFAPAQPCPEAVDDGEGGWYVTVADLTELVEFVRRHGLVVIEAMPVDGVEGVEPSMSLEIYDYYRE